MLENNQQLLEHLIHNTRVVEESSNLAKAFSLINRRYFVPPDYEAEAYEDYSLPIGNGQTISQPTTVGLMLSLLDPRKGERVLDVGFGSGWTSAILGASVGKEGEVVGIDVFDDFLEAGPVHLEKYKDKVAPTFFYSASDKKNIFSRSYDKILINASVVNEVPKEFKKALKEGGMLVAPIDDKLCLFRLQNKKLKQEKCLEGFSFVPYIYEQPQK